MPTGWRSPPTLTVASGLKRWLARETRFFCEPGSPAPSAAPRFGPETALGDPKPFAFESWNIYRVESGKVIERWGLDDLRLALIQMRLPLLRGLIETLPFRADSPPSSAEG